MFRTISTHFPYSKIDVYKFSQITVKWKCFMPDKNTGQELWSTSTCLQLWSTWTGFQLASDNGIYFYFIMRKRRVNFIIFHLVSVHKNCLDPKKKTSQRIQIGLAFCLR